MHSVLSAVGLRSARGCLVHCLFSANRISLLDIVLFSSRIVFFLSGLFVTVSIWHPAASFSNTTIKTLLGWVPVSAKENDRSIDLAFTSFLRYLVEKKLNIEQVTKRF